MTKRNHGIYDIADDPMWVDSFVPNPIYDDSVGWCCEACDGPRKPRTKTKSYLYADGIGDPNGWRLALFIREYNRERDDERAQRARAVRRPPRKSRIKSLTPGRVYPGVVYSDGLRLKGPGDFDFGETLFLAQLLPPWASSLGSRGQRPPSLSIARAIRAAEE